MPSLRKAVWTITLAVFVIALVQAVLSADHDGGGIMMALALILLVGLADIVISGVAVRPLSDRWRIAALGSGAVALLAAAPWVAPLFDGTAGDLAVWAMFAPAVVALFLMARALSPGLAIGASVLAILVIAWATGISALIAYETAWQGLNIRDVSGIDQGDGFGIALSIIFFTVASPVLGLLFGLVSQIGKQRTPAEGASAV